MSFLPTARKTGPKRKEIIMPNFGHIPLEPLYGPPWPNSWDDSDLMVRVRELTDRMKPHCCMLIPHQHEYSLCMATLKRPGDYLFSAWRLILDPDNKVIRMARYF